ncbi:hypothetical protein SDRG_07160 [Saprolegnia diclina VS20]|uniref:Zinc finger PHD-type domain-containing protein n=1 Tax=Saprolegnia diclina (strain VS20) TaxID=1156394 RepID=T0QNR6_SAPDV|nr:hypothetical protein SDRG_07160 [Saprolegnia diclina VS20]EQC35450.1 hypothetical protein SDRG_07160 [Saprolegnia diclina VS20]|eukprot:XP_008611200.1 hypothetical protein SDRG_07160 [Saprolegnia diclina VS20]
MSSAAKRSRPSDECPKCQFNLLDGAGACKVCDFITTKQKLRPCLHCEKANCHVFCDMCGQGLHKRCADKMGVTIDVDEDHPENSSLVCKGCELDENDWNVGCGGCKKGFANEEVGLQINQLVLVEFEFVLYNAIVTEVNEAEDSVKIHFVRWSKSFDGWYKMDDERVNESLACDSCNHWFHIACLPPIKASGRYKHTSYVCERCYGDAKANRKPKVHERIEPIRPKPTIAAAADEDDDEAVLPELPKRKVGRPSLKQLKHERETIALRKAMLKTIKDSKQATKASPPETPATTRTRRAASAPVAVTSSSEKEPPPRKSSRRPDAENDETDRPARKRAAPTSPTTKPSKPETTKATKASVASEDAGKEPLLTATTKKAPAKKDEPVKKTTKAAGDDAPTTTTATTTTTAKKAAKKRDEPTKAKPDTKRPLDLEKVAPRKRSRSDDRGSSHDTFRPIAPKPKPIFEVSSDSDHDIEDDAATSTDDPKVVVVSSSRRKQPTSLKSKPRSIEPEDEDDCQPTPDEQLLKPCVKKGKGSLILLSKLLNSPQFAETELPTQSPPPMLVTKKTLPSLASVTNKEKNQSAFDILRVVASQTITTTHQSPAKAAIQHLPAPPAQEVTLEYDMHFCLREEMYVQVCAMEEAGLLVRDVAGLLRSWTHPTSSRFEDVRFVYLVNKHNSPAILAQRLAEVTRNYG